MRSALPVIAILCLHTVLVITNGYSLRHIDSVMHFSGGIALGMLIAGLLAEVVRRDWCPWPGRWIEATLIISLVATGAVTWEFYEWLSDHYLGTRLQLTLDDTIKDLALGLAGGIISALVNAVSVQSDIPTGKQTPLESTR